MKPGRRYEVVVLEDDQPVLLCRRRLELPEDRNEGTPRGNPWKTVEPPAEWIETCETLAQAKAVAAERSEVLNTLANLFDAETAVSLYKRWDGEIIPR